MGSQSDKLGVNEFTDWTDEEFLATHTDLSGINVISPSEVVDEMMSSWNWNVNNKQSLQIGKQCCCWAFSAIAAVEGLTKIAQVKDGSCWFKAKPAMQIRGFQDVPRNNERALLEAVSRQPVSVGIAATANNFIHYSSGMYTFVGYGTSPEGIKYWLGKNSWGKTWGENSYIRLWRDLEWSEGMCGVAQYASYPVAGLAYPVR